MSYALVLSSLLICGDIEPNPGPVSHPGYKQPALHCENVIPLSTPADGHCFLHSVSMSLFNYLNIVIEHESLIAAIRRELISHQQDYMSFFDSAPSSFHRQVDNYFIKRYYNSSACDIIPLATATTLGIRIVIITGSTRLTVLNEIHPLIPGNVGSYIAVHFANDHYSATTMSNDSTSLSVQPASSPTRCSPTLQHTSSPMRCLPVRQSSSSPTCCTPFLQPTSLSTQGEPVVQHTSSPRHSMPIVQSISWSSHSTPVVQSASSLPCCSPVLQSNPPELISEDHIFVENEHTVTYCNMQDLLSSYKLPYEDDGSHVKTDMLRYLLRFQSTAILYLAETKLSNKISSSEIDIRGFDLFRKDRTRRGGGLTIYCNTSLKPSTISVPSELFSIKLEVFALKVSSQNYDSFLVCAVYRPSSLSAAWVRDY